MRAPFAIARTALLVCLGSTLAVGIAAPAQMTTATSDSSLDGVYRLSSGDKLRITVFNEPRLTGEYGISAAGNVSFPMIGPVTARGQSAEALQAQIRDQLAHRGFIKDAMVNVEVVSYRPYYILGEVNKPGEFPYSVGLKVEQAVAAAGGFTYRARTSAVFLTRAGEQTEHRLKLREQARFVLPGDTIRVGERYF